MNSKFLIAVLTSAVFYNCTCVCAMEDYSTLDVFEEYAVIDDTELFETESFSIVTNKNTPIEEKLRFVSDVADTGFEITTPPEKGTVEITSDEGNFTYTPFTDQTGEDSFSFRLTAADRTSNIASCSITINEDGTPQEPTDAPTQSPEPIGFVYEDMQNHWGNYSAVKMVERDILKGERIGSNYYFYPDTIMRRIDVINYILSALGADLNDVDENETHIFADSAQLPEYINKTAYVAHKLGIIDGSQEGDNVYLRPYDSINRVELIKMIDKAMSSKTRSDVSLDGFIDHGSIPDWAVQHVKNLLGYGIIQGFEDQTLRPFDQLTKAQTVEMLYQMIKYNESSTAETMASRIKKGFYGAIVA